MATYNDVILRAMRLLKVKESGESLAADEASDGLDVMTDIIESWSNERWMQTHITEITHTLTSGDGVYTLGNTGYSGDMQLPETLYCGTLDLDDQDVDAWTSTTSGQFGINVKDAGVTNITCNFSLATDMDGVATVLQAGLRTFTSNTNILCTYNSTDRRFEITTSALPSESISYLTAGTGGTNISSKMKGLSTQATRSALTDFWPVKIQSAFIRDANNFDTPIYPMTDEQYGRIGIKSTQSNYPQAYYYKREYPISKIYLWDVPSSAVTLHLRVWPQWAAPKSGTQTVSFPPGYKRALEYNLAVELAPEYVNGLDPVIMQKATESKAYIKRVNSVPPVMRSGARYIGRNSNRFDINSGSYR